MMLACFGLEKHQDRIICMISGYSLALQRIFSIQFNVSSTVVKATPVTVSAQPQQMQFDRYQRLWSCAREYNIGYITSLLIDFFRTQQIKSGTQLHFPGLFQIQEGAHPSVNRAVTCCQYTMIVNQPPFIGFNWDRACSDFVDCQALLSDLIVLITCLCLPQYAISD